MSAVPVDKASMAGKPDPKTDDSYSEAESSSPKRPASPKTISSWH
jgi:hypothetical protein